MYTESFLPGDEGCYVYFTDKATEEYFRGRIENEHLLPKIKLMNRSYYSDTIENFNLTKPEEIIGKMSIQVNLQMR